MAPKAVMHTLFQRVRKQQEWDQSSVHSHKQKRAQRMRGKCLRNEFISYSSCFGYSKALTLYTFMPV